MNILRVDDSSDLLADYRNLTDVALRRRLEPENGLYMAESAKVLSRALAAGHAPRSVMTAQRWLGDVERILAEHGRPDAPVYVVADEVAERVTGYAVHRGMLAAMNRPAMRSVSEVLAGARRALVLEDVVDHTNVGAAFRSAAAIGVDAVLVTPRCADPLYRRSVRVSMGTVFQVPWTRIDPWPGGIVKLKEVGFTVATLALSDNAITLDELAGDPPERLAWVLGTEGDGLSRGAISAADVVVRIPMARGVDSLNVAAAAAVAAWATR